MGVPREWRGRRRNVIQLRGRRRGKGIVRGRRRRKIGRRRGGKFFGSSGLFLRILLS